MRSLIEFDRDRYFVLFFLIASEDEYDFKGIMWLSGIGLKYLVSVVTGKALELSE